MDEELQEPIKHPLKKVCENAMLTVVCGDTQ